MLQLDGSYLEGGGQIIRTALALSTITQKPFEATNIRKGRPQPGLKSQHLFCIKALEELCNAKSEGAELGSTYLKYSPGKIKPQTLSIDIGTAGSISLLLQSLLIPSILSDSKVRLKITGGTDGKWAMPFDFLDNVFLPHLQKYAEIKTSLIRRGYYPKGGGKVDIKVKPKFNLERLSFSQSLTGGKTNLEKMRGDRVNVSERAYTRSLTKSVSEHFENLKDAPKINLTEQHNLIQIKGISHASLDLQKAEVAERQAKAAKIILNKFNCPIQIRTEYSDTLSTGSGITVWAIFSKNPEEIDFNNPIILGADALGEKTKRSEEVGKESAEKLVKEIESKAPVDSHLADNLMPFLALFGGRIKVSKITGHTLTNIYVCEQFLGKIFEVDKENNIIKAND